MRNPTPSFDYSNKDYEAFRTRMLEQLPLKLPEYTDTRQSDAGVVLIELLSEGLDIISYYQDINANEVYLPTLVQRENAVKWASVLGYLPKYATPTMFNQVFELTNIQEDPTVIPAWTKVKTKGNVLEPEIYFETTQDLIIPAGNIGNEKDASGNYIYTVPVRQGISVLGELLGSGNGTVSQSFTLRYQNVIVDDILILVNSGGGFEPWERVDNFVDSGSDSKHYVVQVNDDDSVTAIFGDGLFGYIPPVMQNSIYADYRVGGGTLGNVGSNTIVELGSTVALIEKTYNPDLPYRYGTDKESIESIKTNAPVANRTIWGALTEKDFAEVTEMNFPVEVVHANAKKDTENPDDIHIYILGVNGEPMSDDLRTRISRLFDENYQGRKIVGANQIILEDATQVSLTLNATGVVKDNYSRSEVTNQITDFLIDYFRIGNIDFGDEIVLAELGAQIMNPNNMIAGIKSFLFSGSTIMTPEDNEIYTFNKLNLSLTGGNE